MKIIDKYDKKILTIYCQLPFPKVFYEIEELNYVNSLDSMLQGQCERLLNGNSFEYAICEKEEFLIEEEFHSIMEDNRSSDILRYYYLYQIVKLILKKYLEE